MNKAPAALLFDLDGTLALKWEPTLLAGRLAVLQQRAKPAPRHPPRLLVAQPDRGYNTADQHGSSS